MSEYTHLELNRDIFAPSGYYTPLKEVRLPYAGREVLYTVSRTVIEATCCGATSYDSVLVAGYILKWQAEKNGDGLPVSEIEPISDAKARDAIRKLIEAGERIPRIEFR